MHPNVKDLTGRAFGRLLVLGASPRPEGSKGRGQHWECICTCLETVVVRSDSLVQGWTTSCGCTNEHAAHARAAIKPRRPKPPAFEHPEADCPKPTRSALLNMHESQSTLSNTSATLPTEQRAREDDGRTRLRWAEPTSDQPAALSLSTRKHSHYFKPCPYDTVDVYRVLDLFKITDQAIGHALKKLLVAGGRGAGKDINRDIQEAIDTLNRWVEMRAEDEAAQ